MPRNAWGWCRPATANASATQKGPGSAHGPERRLGKVAKLISLQVRLNERLVVDDRDGDAADHCRRIENGLLSRWKFPASIGQRGKLVDDEGTAIIAASR